MQMRSLATAFVLAALTYSAVPASAQVTTYGSGINPPGSLAVLNGNPLVGGSFTVGVSNTATSSAPASLAFLSIASAPDGAFPAGTVLPGFGLSSPGGAGELLISFAAPNPLLTLGPKIWLGGIAPAASFALDIPLVPAFSGLTLYLQGTLLDLAGGPSLGLTNGLAVTLAEPTFPGLVPIPAGTFQMGSNAATGSPYFGGSAEMPVHQVTITKPFWMGRFEVTQAEYQVVMGTNPSQFAGLDRPVENVTWFDAVAYCNALNAQQTALGKVPAGYQYRLSTEGEWELACRAGTTTEFHYGLALFCSQARFLLTQHQTPSAICDGPAGTAPVGGYVPNSRGLHDMHGNVWEWCLDSFSSYTTTAKSDPIVVGGPNRVLRGGGFSSSSSSCRSARRVGLQPRIASSPYGFRVVLAPEIAEFGLAANNP